MRPSLCIALLTLLGCQEPSSPTSTLRLQPCLPELGQMLAEASNSPDSQASTIPLVLRMKYATEPKEQISVATALAELGVCPTGSQLSVSQVAAG